MVRHVCRFQQRKKCSIDDAMCPFLCDAALEAECEQRSVAAYNTFPMFHSKRANPRHAQDPESARLYDLLNDTQEEAVSVEIVTEGEPVRVDEDQLIPIDMFL